MRTVLFSFLSFYCAIGVAGPAAKPAKPAKATPAPAPAPASAPVVSAPPAVEARRATIVVAPLVTSSDQEYRWLGLAFSQALVTQLLEVKDVNSLTIRQVASAVRKDNLRTEDLNEESVAQHLGIQLGGDVVVMGSFSAEWPEVTVVARIYRVKDKKVEKTIFLNRPIEDYLTLEKELAKAVFEHLGIKSDPAAVLGTKNLYAIHQATIGFELLNYQSMSPRSEVTLPVGSIKKAKLHFEKALRLDPQYADAHAGLGQALTFLGDYDNARKEFAMAQSTGFNAQAVLGKYYADLRTGRSDDALKGLADAQKSRPGFTHALGTLGDAYNHMGRYREALSTFKRYKTLNPDQPWVTMQLGYTKSKLKRFDEAISDTREAVAMLPESNSFKVELASRLIDADKLQEAEDVLKKALERNPKHPTMNVRLGYIYVIQGKADEAIPALERALQESQNASDHSRTKQLALYDLSRAMALKKNTPRALTYLEEAVKAGFLDIDEIEGEEDLDEVRKDPKFQQIADMIKKPKG